MAKTRYFWDPVEDNVTKEYDENGDTIVRYTTEPDLYGNLISQERDGVSSYYHFDGQGSSLALTNKDGDVTDEYAYSAFGETTEQSGTTVNARRYVGETGYQYVMETDDYYVRRRAYAPSAARWMSVDSLCAASDPFQYCSNNPVHYIDPSGCRHCTVGFSRVNEMIGINAGQGCFVEPRDGYFGFEFEFDARFLEDGTESCCPCCEFRQYVSGYIEEYLVFDRGTEREERTVYGQPQPDESIEDSAIDETGNFLRYGHRSDSPRDPFLDSHGVLRYPDSYSPTRENGCHYTSYDYPGFYPIKLLEVGRDRGLPRPPPNYLAFDVEISLRFLLTVVDVCNDDEIVVQHVYDKECFGRVFPDPYFDRVWP